MSRTRDRDSGSPSRLDASRAKGTRTAIKMSHAASCTRSTPVWGTQFQCKATDATPQSPTSLRLGQVRHGIVHRARAQTAVQGALHVIGHDRSGDGLEALVLGTPRILQIESRNARATMKEGVENRAGPEWAVDERAVGAEQRHGSRTGQCSEVADAVIVAEHGGGAFQELEKLRKRRPSA